MKTLIKICIVLSIVLFNSASSQQIVSKDTIEVHYPKAKEQTYYYSLGVPPQKPMIDKNVVISDELASRILTYKSSENSSPIVKELIKVLKADTLLDADNLVESPYLDCLYCNIDEDINPEMLIIVGTGFQNNIMLIIKQIGSKWNLIYALPIYSKYNDTEIHLVSGISPNRLFYFEETLGSGTGYFNSEYHFFRLLNGKIYNCLNLTGRYHSGFGSLFDTDIDFSNIIYFDNNLAVSYNYDFTINEYYSGRQLKSSFKQSLVKGYETFLFNWDSDKKFYLLNTTDDSENSSDKFKLFQDPENDTLFCEAFKEEIGEIKKNGSKLEKKLLKSLLKEINESKEMK